MAERLQSKSIQLKRAALARLISVIWPIEFREHNQGNLAVLNERLKSGRGTVGLVPHFSKGDFLTILSGLVTNSAEFIKRPVLIPIAAHQKPRYLDRLCTFGDINLATVITLDTRHKEKQLKEAGKPVSWQGLDSDTAMNAYLNRATTTLNEGGVVILAPQAGRRNLLTPFKGGPVSRLEQHCQEMGINDLAYFAVGLEIPGAEDYSKLKGLNIRSRYLVTLGNLINRDHITGNVDAWGYRAMTELAPPAYRPRQAPV